MGVNLLFFFPVFLKKEKLCSPMENAGDARRATALSTCQASFTG
jgi:hypothetical protein